MESIEGDGLIGVVDFFSDGCHQTIVFGDTQVESLIASAVTEEYHHVRFRLVGIEHGINGKRLAAQVACACRRGNLASVETQTGGKRDVARVGRPQHLEVVQVAQIVVCNGFGESQYDIIADVQYAVLGLREPEELRPTCVLHARQHIRRAGQEAARIAAVVDGTQVILLFYRVAFTPEGGHDLSVVLDELADTYGSCHQAVALVVGAHVHPVLVALRGELVLQFDVVEVAVVDVEAVDADRHIVLLPLAVVL